MSSFGNNNFLRPENALKRSAEYTAIGDNEGALKLLHDVLSQRKVRTWQKTYESIMVRYLDLCIELKDHNRSKDGLHQYRNLSQNQAPGSLEVVINHFIDSAEARLKEAAANAEAAVVAAERVTDLEMGATPESIMLSTMTEEGERQRKERKLLVPWLIFVWESYRAVLDILRTSSKLEVVYHKTAERAFDFCDNFKRKVEFRRLCDMLRIHLGHLAKAGMAGTTAAAPNDRRLRGWDGFSDDSIEMHLTTRFKQLEITTKLELWSEGFRTVEDIHAIMHISPKAPKSKVMANYYDKLIKIFWVSENYLFHAYAWLKFYALSDSFNTRMTDEERQNMANSVVLAALSIPDASSSVGDGVVAGGGNGLGGASKSEDKANIDSVATAAMLKNQHMASLLGFHSNPNRTALLTDLINRKLLDLVSPHVKSLYDSLETTFQPLDLVQKVTPLLSAVSESKSDQQMVTPLTRLVVLRLLKQLSAVYYTVKVDHFLNLVKDLGYSHDDLERIIVVAVKAKYLAVRIDHQTNCLRFGEVALESDHMKTQLTTLANQLLKVNAIIKPMKADDKEATDRIKFFARVRDNMEAEHVSTLNRKNIIEHRKEEQEKREIELQKLAELAAIEAEKERLALEKERQEQERNERERKKREKMLGEYNLMTTKELLKKSGVDTSNIKTLTERETDNLLTKAQKEAEAAAAAEEARKVEQFKKFDYSIRAIRDSERPLLVKQREEELVQAKIDFDKDAELRSEQAKIQFKADSELKQKVGSMLVFTRDFECSIIESRKKQYELNIQAKKQEAYNRKIARARRLKFEKEEEEEQAEYERERAEEEARIREEEAQYAEERAREERARQLEEAALAKERSAAEEASARKREQLLEEAKQIKAQRGDTEEASSPATTTQAPAPSDGKWRPRSMMDRNTGGAPTPSEGGGRWSALGSGGAARDSRDMGSHRDVERQRNPDSRFGAPLGSAGSSRESRDMGSHRDVERQRPSQPEPRNDKGRW